MAICHHLLTGILSFPSHCLQRHKKNGKEKERTRKVQGILVCAHSELPSPALDCPVLLRLGVKGCGWHSSEEWPPCCLGSHHCWYYCVWFLETQDSRIWKSQKVTVGFLGFFSPIRLAIYRKGFFFFLMAVQFLLVICTTNMSWAGFYFDSWGHTIAVFFSTLCVLWRGNYFGVVCMDFFFNL